MPTALQRKTALAGAALLLGGYATGGLLAAAETGKVHADAHTVAASHLNAILGCFWLAALACTLPMLRFGETGQRRIVGLAVGSAYMNWIVTAGKAFFFVRGVEFDGHGANDAVFVVLTLTVVIPAFASVAGWVWGLAGETKIDA